MNTEQIKHKVKTILSLPNGSAGRGVIGRDTAQAMLDAIESLEAELDSALKQFKAERIRADLAVAQFDDLRATISGPSKEIDKLKFRIESLSARVDLFESTAPTPFAYNAACKALDKHRARADAAEEEIARRDAAAGDPVAWKWRLTSLFDGEQIGPWRVCLSPQTPGNGDGCKTESIALYTAAAPAILPPEQGKPS